MWVEEGALLLDVVLNLVGETGEVVAVARADTMEAFSAVVDHVDGAADVEEEDREGCEVGEVEDVVTAGEKRLGKLADDEDKKAPKKIRVTYPKRKDVLKNRDMSDYVLEYRGLYDLTAINIHCGDIMMAYGKIENVL